MVSSRLHRIRRVVEHVDQLGLDPGEAVRVHDLLERDECRWIVGANFVDLYPASLPAHVFHLTSEPGADAAETVDET